MGKKRKRKYIATEIPSKKEEEMPVKQNPIEKETITTTVPKTEEDQNPKSKGYCCDCIIY